MNILSPPPPLNLMLTVYCFIVFASVKIIEMLKDKSWNPICLPSQRDQIQCVFFQAMFTYL